MLFCNSCKVHILGERQRCPLCGGALTGEGEPDTQLYPIVPPPRYSRHFLLRLISFVVIAGIAVSTAVNAIVSPGVWWSLFVSAGLICSWLTLAVAVSKRSHILKNIAWQLFLITVLAVLWDLATGWRGWSLDYVLPCSCMASMGSMYILSKILKIPARELVFYLILDSVYGVIPIIFVLTGLLHTAIPSILCIMVSVISIAAILLFEWRDIKEVIIRKFHV